MADTYPRSSAVVYKTVVDNVLAMAKDPETQRKFAVAVLEYGIYGKHSFEDDIYINGLMKQPELLADQTAIRYDKAKANGATGGAITKGKRERWTNEDVYQYYKVENHTLEDAVQHFGYSKRTIQDKCKKYIETVKQIDVAVPQPPVEPVIPEKVDGEWKF